MSWTPTGKRKQRSVDQTATKKVALLQQLEKIQLELKTANELHIVQQQELAEPERLLGLETTRVQALELELQEACRPKGAASSFAAPRVVEVLDPRQKAAAIQEIIGTDVEEVLHLLLESIREKKLAAPRSCNCSSLPKTAQRRPKQAH